MSHSLHARWELEMRFPCGCEGEVVSNGFHFIFKWWDGARSVGEEADCMTQAADFSCLEACGEGAERELVPRRFVERPVMVGVEEKTLDDG